MPKKAAEERIMLVVDDRQYRRTIDRAEAQVKTLRKDVDRLRGEHRKASRAAEDYGTRSGRAHRRGAAAVDAQAGKVGMLAGMWRSLIATVGLFAAGAALRGVFQMNAGLEQTRISFRTLIGDANRADAALSSLFEFAETTPFRQDETIAAARSLLAFGFAAEQLEPTLRSLGDVAAGLGIPFDELAQIYGKARVQGQIMMEDIHQLTGRGIPIMDALAEVMKVNTGEVRALVSAGKVGFPQLEAAFATLTDGVGDLDFQGLMVAQSESASGLISTILDLAQASLRAVTSGAFELLKSDLSGIRDRIMAIREDGTLAEWSAKLAGYVKGAYEAGRSFVALLREWGPVMGRVALVVGAYAAALATVRLATVAWSVATAAAAAIQTTYRVAIAAATVATNLLRGSLVGAGIAAQAFNTAVRANPIGLLVTVLGTAVVALSAFARSTDDAADATERANQKTRERIALLRQMGGAELAADRQRRQADARDAARRYAELQERKAAILRGDVTFTDRTTQIGTGGERATVTVTAETQRARALLAINADLAEVGQEITAARAAAFQAERESQRNLDDRLAYLRAEFDRVTAITDQTAATRAEAAGYREEIERVQATLDARRGADDGPTGPGPGKPQTAAQARAAANRAAAERARVQAAEDAADAFAQAVERRNEVLAASTAAELAAIEAVHDAEDDLAEHRDDLSENRARMSADERAAADALTDALERQLESLRSIRRLTVATSAVAWSGLAGPARLGARGLSHTGGVTAKEIAGVTESVDALNRKVKEAIDKVPDLVPLDELREAVGLADEVARLFAFMGATLAADVASGIGDVIHATDRLRKAQERAREAGKGGGILSSTGAAAGALGVVGAGLGVLGAVHGFFQAEAAEGRRRADALARNTAAVEANTRAFGSGQIGDDLDGAQRGAIADLLADIQSPAFGRNSVGDNARWLANRLAELEAMGVDVADIRAMAEDGHIRSAVNALQTRFAGLADALGTYSDDLTGQLAAFDDRLSLTGIEGQEAFRRFLAYVRAAGQDIGDLSAVLTAAESGDPAAAVAAAFEAIENGDFDFGDLSASQVQDVLRRILSLSGAGANGGAATSTTVSTATVAQADLMNAYLQQQLRSDLAREAILSQIHAALTTGTGPTTSATSATSSGRSVDVGGVTVNVPSASVTAAEVRAWMPYIERALVRNLVSPDVTRGRSV